MTIFDAGKSIAEALSELLEKNDAILKIVQSKPWWETYAPGFYIIVGAVLAFITQWRMFKLQEKKELTLFNNSMKKEVNFKVAELYGKLNSLCPEYNIIFGKYNNASVKFHYNTFISKYLGEILFKENGDANLTIERRTSFLNRYNYAKKALEEHNKFSDEEWTLLMNQKLKVLEILHQLQFYYKQDEKLEKLVNEFQAISSHKPKFIEYKAEMSDPDYLNKYIEGNVRPLNVSLKDLSTQIFTYVRKL